MDDCNVALKVKGKMCPCRLALGHLGDHEYKKPDKKGDISNEGAFVALVISTAIILLFYFAVTERWGQDPSFFLAGVGLAILTTFAGVAWLVSVGSLKIGRASCRERV